MSNESAWFHSATYHGPDTDFGPSSQTERYEDPPRFPTPAVVAAAAADAPPVLYLPCDRPPADGEVSVQTRVMKDGRVALLAYTALDRLAGHCGSTQPWVLVRTAALDELDRVCPFDVVLLDVAVPHESRTDAGTNR
jgi:hypothetical protein